MGAATRPEHIGRFIDAQNAAFADRNLYMADADFVDVPQDGFAGKAYARVRRQVGRDSWKDKAFVQLCLAPGFGDTP